MAPFALVTETKKKKKESTVCSSEYQKSSCCFTLFRLLVPEVKISSAAQSYDLIVSPS